MQVTNDTRKILGDDEGEIKDHYVNVSREDLDDPGVNICAGVRWLFHKRDLLSKKLKRQASEFVSKVRPKDVEGKDEFLKSYKEALAESRYYAKAAKDFDSQ